MGFERLKEGKTSIAKGPAFVTVLGLILFLCLGTWQIQRLHWKEDLIQQFTFQMSQLPQDLQNFTRLKLYSLSQTEKEALEFKPIKVTGTFSNSLKLKLQGRPLRGKDGYHLVMPLQLKDGSCILVDRGWMPQRQEFEEVNKERQVILEGYIRWQSDQNFMTPENSYKTHEIFSIFPQEAALKLSLPGLWPFYIVQTSQDKTLPFPEPAKKTLSLRNFHLQYAITWYGLALALLVFYGVFLKRQQAL